MGSLREQEEADSGVLSTCCVDCLSNCTDIIYTNDFFLQINKGITNGEGFYTSKNVFLLIQITFTFSNVLQKALVWAEIQLLYASSS